jgi:hypothetical protein
MTVQAIPIELIRTDGGTQIRDCKTMQTKIDEYVLAMNEGADFPPLTVFWDGEHYWLADGFHRLGAYNICMQAMELTGLDAGQSHMEFAVVEGWRRLLEKWRYQLGSRVPERRGTRVDTFLCS